jgi:dTDP-4-dehydrorhamnose 3,5-epimerase
MKIIKTKFKNLLIIKQPKFKDHRGNLRITYHDKKINFNKFIFDYAVKSKINVLRGLHFQYKNQQAKLISVLKGRIFDAVVDLRKNSKTFGKFYSIILSENNCKSLYVPEGFAHGYYCLEKENIIYYRLSDHYNPYFESGLIWNDSKIKIDWPTGTKILSKKDKTLKKFNIFLEKHKGL